MVSCSILSDEHTLHGSNINMLDPCWHSLHGLLANFLCVAHCVLLGRNSLRVHRVTHSLHNIDVCSETLQNIAAALSASLLSFVVADWKTFLHVLHHVVHMINWCFNYCRILRHDFFLLQDFLQPCNHIAHHVCVVHVGVFHGEIEVFLDLLVCCPKKNIEPDPCPLDCCHAVPFANRQSKLACPMDNDVSYVHRLVLGLQRSGDVGELKKFFNIGEYGRYRV